MNFIEASKVEDNQDSDETAKNDYADYNIIWQEITHATLIIGWGYDEDKEMKYWLIRNSYGPSYGINGNFKLRRGMNDYGAESDNSAATVELLEI